MSVSRRIRRAGWAICLAALALALVRTAVRRLPYSRCSCDLGGIRCWVPTRDERCADCLAWCEPPREEESV